MAMGLEESKQDFMDFLDEVGNEAETLIKRVEKAKLKLQSVKTQADADKFNSENDIEDGFEHIKLF